ncbi:purine nucleotide synthesis repressor [Salmonella enterica subsp. arizonae]|nr:purine nucleotide synthesis repressor [Salmonella enterica subsp. arizonae]
MATIKDVAKRANVSTTTVSHVINKTRFVAEETRNAVWAAIKELHYSPSAVARSLKVNHTKSIGLLATSSEAAYFAEIIEAVEKNCFQKGYTLILGNAWNNLEKQRAYLSMMAQKRVDGLLVMCSEYPEPLLSMLEEYRHIPMVVMDWGEAKADFTDTVIDNAFEGGYMAGRYLVERGHRDIGVIPGPLERNTGAGRLAGFMKAMEEALIKVPDNWIVQGDFEPESGYHAMQQILSQSHRPTAVFCGGDIMAMGALCAADEMGLRVPQDVSVIGYDNVRNARFFTPALTTIHQPKDSLGEPHLICFWIASSISARSRSLLKFIRAWLSAARSLTARSATIAVNLRCREPLLAPAATRGSAFRYPPNSPATTPEQARLHFAATSRNRPHRETGFLTSAPPIHRCLSTVGQSASAPFPRIILPTGRLQRIPSPALRPFFGYPAAR